ncbi:hypothetical protein L1887_12429 [Cichorium endivia]|nr:hypothetical protein L1887_12429 [Cichorium endivia]
MDAHPPYLPLEEVPPPMVDISPLIHICRVPPIENKPGVQTNRLDQRDESCFADYDVKCHGCFNTCIEISLSPDKMVDGGTNDHELVSGMSSTLTEFLFGICEIKSLIRTYSANTFFENTFS